MCGRNENKDEVGKSMLKKKNMQLWCMRSLWQILNAKYVTLPFSLSKQPNHFTSPYHTASHLSSHCFTPPCLAAPHLTCLISSHLILRCAPEPDYLYLLFLCLTLPYLTLPYLTLPYLTLPTHTRHSSEWRQLESNKCSQRTEKRAYILWRNIGRGK